MTLLLALTSEQGFTGGSLISSCWFEPKGLIERASLAALVIEYGPIDCRQGSGLGVRRLSPAGKTLNGYRSSLRISRLGACFPGRFARPTLKCIGECTDFLITEKPGNFGYRQVLIGQVLRGQVASQAVQDV